MKIGRREFLVLGGIAGASGCIRPRPEMRVLPSLARLPEPFKVELPIPPVAKATSADCYEMDVRPVSARILPGLNTTVWGYGGVFPGPTIEARRGRRVTLRLRNRLPVPIVNHLHGGRTAPESDGYPTDLILPDGDSATGGHMRDARARISHGEREHTYENDQRAATLWYHDHRMDFTGAQVWRGLAGFYLIRDEEEDRLPLPRGDRAIGRSRRTGRFGIRRCGRDRALRRSTRVGCSAM
jgi:spore coat protein A